MKVRIDAEKPSRFEILVQELMNSGMDFSLSENQTCIQFFAEDSDYCIHLYENGKWEIM